MVQKNKRRFGSLGESIALKNLITDGYRIITRNFRVGRMGEIDIIARENEYICFIEVKSRSSTLYGTPSEAVNFKKQENIRKLAQIYLLNHKMMDTALRFDVVEVLFEKIEGVSRVKSVHIIKGAF